MNKLSKNKQDKFRNRFINRIKETRTYFPEMIRYEILIKLLMGLAILPAYQLLRNFLLKAGGYTVLTNESIAKFVLTLPGVALLVLTILLVVFGLAFEIGGVIITGSNMIQARRRIKFTSLVKYNFGLMRKLLGFGGFLVIFLFALVAPLTDMGIGLSFLKGLKIPDFITSVIFANYTYLAIYGAVLGILTLIMFASLFTFHFIIIGNMGTFQAMRASARLVKRNLRRIIGDMLKILLLAFLMVVVLVLLSTFLNQFFVNRLTEDDIVWVSIVVLAKTMFLYVGGLVFASFIAVPVTIHDLTCHFYELVAIDPTYQYLSHAYPNLEARTKRLGLEKWVFKHKIITTFLLFFTALSMSVFYVAYRIMDKPPISLISHRTGGVTSPENSIVGLQEAISQKVDAVEIDVHRTKDGFYVLNHDIDFKRVANDSRKVTDMTLSQIKALTLSHDGKTATVPTLEEFLRAAKGKMKVFIELKSPTADSKMGQDVVALIKRLGMQSETVIITFVYPIIVEIETRTPEIATGPLYFISLGDIKNLLGDYMLIEQVEATPAKLASITEANKKSIVWTVNNDEAILKTAQLEVDGLITDYPVKVKADIEKIRQGRLRTRLFRLLQEFKVA